MPHRLWKPWFVHRPAQLARRLAVLVRPPAAGYVPLETAWGARIVADPTRTLGRSILTTGVYDLAVSEAVARLVAPGDTVVDAGAHVGYVTVLAGVVAGPGGRVMSFEPHPDLFAFARRNVEDARRRFPLAAVDLRLLALGDRPGTATLEEPAGFSANDATARIADTPGPGARVLTVRVERLDACLGNEPVGLLKLDVEGSEAQALRGAERALRRRRIRHVLFEDHAIEGSEAARLLRQAGYHLFSLGWSMRGPVVRPIEAGSLATRYEAPSFIATIEPEEILARCRPAGWLVLGALGRRRG